MCEDSETKTGCRLQLLLQRGVQVKREASVSHTATAAESNSLPRCCLTGYTVAAGEGQKRQKSITSCSEGRQNWEGPERSFQKLPSESLGVSHTGRTFRMYHQSVLVVSCQKQVPSSPDNFYEGTTWPCRQDFSSFILKA